MLQRATVCPPPRRFLACNRHHRHPWRANVVQSLDQSMQRERRRTSVAAEESVVVVSESGTGPDSARRVIDASPDLASAIASG